MLIFLIDPKHAKCENKKMLCKVFQLIIQIIGNIFIRMTEKNHEFHFSTLKIGRKVAELPKLQNIFFVMQRKPQFFARFSFRNFIYLSNHW